jgi:hypothetical protein
VLARVILIALIAAAALADAGGAHGAAYVLILCAVVAAAIQAVAGYLDLVREPEGFDTDPIARVQAILEALTVLLLVASAAVRSPALFDPGVPALGASALAGALAIQAIQCALYVAGELRRRSALRRRHAGMPLPR